MRNLKKKRNGIALIVCMIFLAIFGALAVGMAGMADTNAQLARNQHNGSLAFTSAQSGLEVMRYWLDKVDIDSSVLASDRLKKVASKINSLSGVNISAVYNDTAKTITIPIVALDSTTTGPKFSAVLYAINSNNQIRATITGSYGDAKKKVVVDYNVVPYGNGVFAYGVATKGTMSMTGNATISDVNITVKSGVYIEADGAAGNAFSSTHNTSVAGDVSIANQYATTSVGGSVGGVQGGTGHVHIGVPEVDFPTPDPQHFLQYATVQAIDPKKVTVLSNVIIPANTNPTFAKDVTINGVLYIETPNKVHFSGKATVNAIIAGAGIDDGHNGTSDLTFSGQVVSNDVSTLVGSQYDAIKKETGTFICAPGFALTFTGQNLNMGGAIAGNGISFSGQAGGIVKNSIINYSKDADSMTMVGQGNLTFNRSGREAPPAGFGAGQKLDFMANSYSESL